MAIAEDAATVLEQFVHDGNTLATTCLRDRGS